MAVSFAPQNICSGGSVINTE